VSPAKYMQVAGRVRAQIADGMLMPGEPAPSGAALARVTGYSTLTCRKALRILISDGVLVAGASPGARPRVPALAPTHGERTLSVAARALSSALAARRRSAGLTQPQLAEIVGLSVTAIGHAETGRLWQSRRFWEHVDKGVSAGGELLVLHDAYRAQPQGGRQANWTLPASRTLPKRCQRRVSIMIVWSDGAITGVPMERDIKP
jgi:DNA-binding transcriptional regulator YhcF (GntR family)